MQSQSTVSHEDDFDDRRPRPVLDALRPPIAPGRAEATSVTVVGLRMPFDDVLTLAFQILVVQTIFATIVLLILAMIGVITF